MNQRPIVIVNNRSGIGLIGSIFLVVLIFLVLKLAGTLAWSWAWVFAPIWIPVVVFVGLVAAAFIIGGSIGCVRSVISTIKRNRRLAKQVEALKNGGPS